MILKNGLVMDDSFTLRRCDVQIENGLITGIGENLTDSSVIDVSGCFVLPGFIDSHIHGAVGHKISDRNPDLQAVTRYEATQGVTSVAFSTVCSDFDHLLHQIDIAAAAAAKTAGAKVTAIHAEGPFISPAKKGAMDARHILAPDRRQLDLMIEHGQGLLRLISLAPEVEGCLELIPYAVSRGLTVSMGHTDATYAQACAAIAAGAAQTTHTFNAMRSLNHREPGVLGAALTNDSVCCEMICDHTHLHPAVIRLIYQAKGAGKINIISDSEYGAGIDASEITVDGEVRYIRNGVMVLEDGTIAGSASSMLYGIRNLLADGIPLTDVSRMASINPARTLKIDRQTGSIALGKAADIVILDHEYNVCSTYADGVCVYQKGE